MIISRLKILKITGITLIILLFIVFLCWVDLKISYKDEVDIMKTAISVSNDITKTEKKLELRKVQMLGYEIIKELKILKILMVTILIILSFNIVFWVRFSSK